MAAPFTTLAPSATPGRRYSFSAKTAVTPLDLTGEIRVRNQHAYRVRGLHEYRVRRQHGYRVRSLT